MCITEHAHGTRDGKNRKLMNDREGRRNNRLCFFGFTATEQSDLVVELIPCRYRVSPWLLHHYYTVLRFSLILF